MSFDRNRINLRALNSLTKYPSIPTYHELDPRNGGLLDAPVHFEGKVIGTEKVDGTNARIILLPGGGYMLGSREELLYASGDLIGNPALGIVEALKPVAEKLPEVIGDDPVDRDEARVYYVELYGGKIGGQAKQYTTRGTVGWRLFDVAHLDDLGEMLLWPVERISAWRDNGGQNFAHEQFLQGMAEDAGFDVTPRLFEVFGPDLPTDVQGMYAFLGEQLPATLVGLDGSGHGRPEGIVLRSPDRKVIAKARFQDYERTLKRRAKNR